MHKIKRFFPYFALLMISFNLSVDAMNLGLSVSSQIWDGGGAGYYSTTDPTTHYQQIYFDVTFDSGDSGKYFVTFSPGLNAPSNYNRRLESTSADQLETQIYRDMSAGESVLLKDINDATRNQIVAGELTGAEVSPLQMSFYWCIGAEQNMPEGSYTDSIEMNIYEGEIYRTYTFAAGPYSLDLAATIPSDLSLSVVSDGGAYDENVTSQTLDFAELVEGESQQVDVIIMSNAGYDLSFESLNSGVLASDMGYSSTIPYALKVDTVTQDLSSGGAVLVASSNSASAASGDRYDVEVVIGSITGAFPEGYSDVISISVAVN